MWLAGKILLLLCAVNGAPIVLLRLWDGRGAWAIDGGRRCFDGRPWLGPSKTWRGLAGALLAGGLAGWALGLGAWVGLQAAALAMTGDVCSSFFKRRLGVPSSGMALGVDQIPESLLPLLWLQEEWGLDGAEVAGLVLAFVGVELALSRVLYWLHIRRQPY
jgi:CDP-2,3-bis-(O-geranylgeranyl)-sn-glycerol synthase